MAYQVLYLKDIPELKSRRGNAITPLLAVILGLNYPITEAVAAYEWQDGSVVATDDVEAVGSLLGDPNTGRWIRVDLSQIPQVNSDWNSVTGPSEILNKPTIPAAAPLIQRIRIQSNTSGLATWNFPVAFSAAPIVQVTVEDGSAASWQHQILNVSTTTVQIQLGKLTATTLLGINLLQIASNPQAYVHITAIAP